MKRRTGQNKEGSGNSGHKATETRQARLSKVAVGEKVIGELGRILFILRRRYIVKYLMVVWKWENRHSVKKQPPQASESHPVEGFRRNATSTRPECSGDSGWNRLMEETYEAMRWTEP